MYGIKRNEHSFTDEEIRTVKDALIELIEECRGGGFIGESASARLEAVARGTEALLMLDGNYPSS